jgi:hypothetical protein
MSFHFRSWLRRLNLRLVGRRFTWTAPAVRPKGKQRCGSLRPCLEILEARETPATGLTSIAAGA